MTSKFGISLPLPPPYLSKSVSDTGLYFALTLLARQWRLRCTPPLAVITATFFTMRLGLHALDHYSSNSYAIGYKRRCTKYTERLITAVSYCPRARSITYLASIALAYLHMPTSLALSAFCGVSLGLLNPI